MSEHNPTPGSYMDRVDKAGGIEAYEEAKKFMKEVSKVKPEQWKGLTETFKTVKGFLDLSANDAISSITEGIVETARLKFEEVLAPLKNEMNAQINKILEPLLPFINQMVQLVIPVIDWIAGVVGDIVKLVQSDFNPWEAAINSPAVQWVLDNPGSNYVDYLLYLRILEARANQKSTPPGVDKILDLEKELF